MRNQLLMGAGMVLATLAVIWAGSARAGIDRFNGLVCKTPEGVQSLYALHEQTGAEDNLDNLNAEIKAINEKLGAGTCGTMAVFEEDKEVVKTFPYKDKDLDVWRIEISAVCHENYCIFGDSPPMYLAAPSKPKV